ncbi:MAG: hypothetical protein AAF211_14275, partial [Myxococcota bacterium]
MRAVSVLTVEDPVVFEQIALAVPLDAHTLATPSPTERVVDPAFGKLLPELEKRGLSVLVRNARRPEAAIEAARSDVTARVDRLSDAARVLLERGQRHARDHVVLGLHVFDPGTDQAIVDELLHAGLVEALHDEEGEVLDAAPRGLGRFVLHPDLPVPASLPWDFEEAVMAETDDLESIADTQAGATLGTGPVDLLHDVASLAAAIQGWRPRRTLAGPLTKADGRKLGQRLGSPEVASTGSLEADPRWGRALRALEALGALSLDAVTRELHLDLGLEDVLAGSTADAIDRLVHRLVDADLRPLLPMIRAALAAARTDALDEVVLVDLVREQHRDLLFRPWVRQGVALYPMLGDAVVRRFDDDGFDEVEAPMLEAALRRLFRLGLVRRGPGVLAATDD